MRAETDGGALADTGADADSKIVDMMAEDAAREPVLTDEGLSRIAMLAGRQVDLERSIADAEKDLKQLKQEFDDVRDHLLPEALLEVGLSEIKLKDGNKIAVKREYFASISEKNKREAFEWLRENGHFDIVKNELVIDLEKGDGRLVEGRRFEILAEELGIKYATKNSVHWSTLRAFVREQIEAGADIPMDAFGVHVVDRATIKR